MPSAARSTARRQTVLLVHISVNGAGRLTTLGQGPPAMIPLGTRQRIEPVGLVDQAAHGFQQKRRLLGRQILEAQLRDQLTPVRLQPTHFTPVAVTGRSEHLPATLTALLDEPQTLIQGDAGQRRRAGRVTLGGHGAAGAI